MLHDLASRIAITFSQSHRLRPEHQDSHKIENVLALSNGQGHNMIAWNIMNAETIFPGHAIAWNINAAENKKICSFMTPSNEGKENLSIS